MSVQHNFYQLMELDWYCDIKVIRKKYKELAKKYHPDKFPNDKHAEEYFKIITQGYHILSKPSDKKDYDNAIYQYYSKSKSTQKDGAYLLEKIKQNKAVKLNSIIKDHQKWEADLSHKKRLWLSVFMFISSFLFAYNNWYVNHLTMDNLYIIIAYLIFGLSCYMIANIHYKKSQYHMACLGKIKNDNHSSSVFLKLFLITPIVFFATVSVTKTIHLNYFSIVIPIESVVIEQEEINYIYNIGNKKILRKTSFDNSINYANKKGLRAKVSKINPNISELIETTD